MPHIHSSVPLSSRIPTEKKITSVTSTIVATKGADEAAGSNRAAAAQTAERNRSVPHTHPTSANADRERDQEPVDAVDVWKTPTTA